MLKIDELKVSYGGIEAVKGITFEVPDGKIVTSSGPTERANPPPCGPSPAW